MREVLAQQKDGYYYSLFSNQCQDWADRLRRSAERLEAQRGLKEKVSAHPSAPHYSKPVSPTEPASIWMGVLAMILGTASILGPIVAGDLFTILIGIVFLVSGASHVLYGLHAKDWRNLLHFLLLALGLSVGGVLILLNLHFADVASGTLLAILITIQGVNSIIVGAGNRPLIRGLGPLSGWLRNARVRRSDYRPLAREQRCFAWALGRSCPDGGWLVDHLAELDDPARRRVTSRCRPRPKN